jgi:hypothetical protein
MEFIPYWLICEAPHSHGFATVPGPEASTSDEAIATWKKSARPDLLRDLESFGTVLRARLIDEPLGTQ